MDPMLTSACICSHVKSQWKENLQRKHWILLFKKWCHISGSCDLLAPCQHSQGSAAHIYYFLKGCWLHPVLSFFSSPWRWSLQPAFICMKHRRWGDGEGSGNDTGSTLSSLASRLRLTAAHPSGYSDRVLLKGQRHMGWGSCLVGGDCVIKGEKQGTLLRHVLLSQHTVDQNKKHLPYMPSHPVNPSCSSLSLLLFFSLVLISCKLSSLSSTNLKTFPSLNSATIFLYLYFSVKTFVQLLILCTCLNIVLHKLDSSQQLPDCWFKI